MVYNIKLLINLLERITDSLLFDLQARQHHIWNSSSYSQIKVHRKAHKILVNTAWNTVISPNFLARKFCGNLVSTEVRAIRPKLCCAFPQNFRKKKLGEISVFHGVRACKFATCWLNDRIISCICWGCIPLLALFSDPSKTDMKI